MDYSCETVVRKEETLTSGTLSAFETVSSLSCPFFRSFNWLITFHADFGGNKISKMLVMKAYFFVLRPRLTFPNSWCTRSKLQSP